MEPLVTVVIPTYNRVSLVGQAIASARSQSYLPLHIVVVDDGSTDATPALPAQMRPDPSLTVVRHDTNRGASAAKNTGLDHMPAETAFFGILDSDDELRRGSGEGSRSGLRRSRGPFSRRRSAGARTPFPGSGPALPPLRQAPSRTLTRCAADSPVNSGSSPALTFWTASDSTSERWAAKDGCGPASCGRRLHTSSATTRAPIRSKRTRSDLPYPRTTGVPRSARCGRTARSSTVSARTLRTPVRAITACFWRRLQSGERWRRSPLRRSCRTRCDTVRALPPQPERRARAAAAFRPAGAAGGAAFARAVGVGAAGMPTPRLRPHRR